MKDLLDKLTAEGPSRRPRFTDKLTPEQLSVLFGMRRRFREGTAACSYREGHRRYCEHFGKRLFSHDSWSRFMADDGTEFPEQAHVESDKKRRR